MPRPPSSLPAWVCGSTLTKTTRTAPLDANYTGRWEDMSIVERVWEVTKGSVGHVPIYAAAALVPIAVALAMATIGVGQRDRPDEYVDPRQRRW